MDNDALKEHAEALSKGLNLLNRDRKVVMPHNKTFDLVDELKIRVDKIIRIAEEQ